MAKKDRTFVRGMTSETYTLNQFRRAQLAAPRVRDDSVIVDTGDNAGRDWSVIDCVQQHDRAVAQQ